ncbi:uncharacterized protein DNG_03037 [Cephalotrichum gorgonifer]|uniref:Uncharacterized protein n=1 Tax=Cephalotrichum gorgonifer TaxID=2041049 RepID=A0AAE8MU33_9PEZI|nr:uncharacterized protein DNG_03037 [Cephalotrichum gorgonifer]
MTFYCSNYYGSIQCQTTVTRFGDRCKLCTVMRVGSSISDGLLPDSMVHTAADAARSAEIEKFRRETESAIRKEVRMAK